jgi:RNA polymerase sigma-70 factor (ECF subfamily)
MLVQIDVAVIIRARCGDEAAFAVIVRAHEPLIFRYILREVRERELAEDLTQEVFLRAWRALPTFGFRSQLTTWLYQVARNILIDHRRHLGRRISEVELVAELVPAVADQGIELGETVDALWAAVEGLDASLKMPLLLRDVAGLTYNEIAASLDIPLSTVKWRIYQARETIQLALGDEDGSGLATLSG